MTTTTLPARVSITAKASEVLAQVREEHGELVFHQSGGCCDGSSPMCLKKSEFFIGARDILVGEIDGCSFYMSPDQFSYFKHSHVTIDAVVGRGSSFSLEIPLGYRFMAVSRLFSDEELAQLEETQPA
ncbi:MAG: DUF779 domain-containing protein [Acidobacteriota bacterium]